MKIQELTLSELKIYLKYANHVDILAHHFCPRGTMFLVRKEHTARELGFSIGNDTVIMNPLDCEDI